jgi:hypothetical protein
MLSSNNVASSSSFSSSSRVARSSRRRRDDEDDDEDEDDEEDEGEDEEGFGGSGSADVTALLEGGNRTSQAIFRETVILNALAEQPLIEVRVMYYCAMACLIHSAFFFHSSFHVVLFDFRLFFILATYQFRELNRRIVNLENEASTATTVGDTFDKRAGLGLMLPSSKPALYRSSSISSTSSAGGGAASAAANMMDHRTLTSLLNGLEARQLVRLVPRMRVPARRPCVRNLVARWALPLCPGEAEARFKAGLPPWQPPQANSDDRLGRRGRGSGSTGSSSSSSSSSTALDSALDPSEALDDLARRLDAARSFVTPSGLAGTLSGGGADGTWAGDTNALPVIARIDPALLPRPQEGESSVRSNEDWGATWDEEEAANGVGHGGGMIENRRPTPKELTSLYRVRTRFDYVPGIMPRASLFLRAILTIPNATTTTSAIGSTVRGGTGGEARVNISALMCNLPLSQWLRVFGADLTVAGEYDGQDKPPGDAHPGCDPSHNRDVNADDNEEVAGEEASSGKIMSKLIEAIEVGGAGEKAVCCLPPYLFEAMMGAVQGSRAIKEMRRRWIKSNGDGSMLLGDRRKWINSNGDGSMLLGDR